MALKNNQLHYGLIEYFCTPYNLTESLLVKHETKKISKLHMFHTDHLKTSFKFTNVRNFKLDRLIKGFK